MLKKIKILISLVLLMPFWFMIKRLNQNQIIFGDIKAWLTNYHKRDIVNFRSFVWLMVYHQAFRNVLYFRIKSVSLFISWLYTSQREPIISVEEKIGKGLFFCHGFSTIIAAKSIGENCWINQQVTIGDSSTGVPTIGNNVSIFAGAIVLGNIAVGDNAIIGAGAIVVKNVPENCTVVGNPARIVKRNGLNVSEKL